MKRETFIQIMSALIAEADAELLVEAKGLVFWRERALRTERVQQFEPGQIIEWQEPGGRLTCSLIDHLNSFSVSIKLGAGQNQAVPIEWVRGLRTTVGLPTDDLAVTFGVTDEAITDQYDRYVRGRG